jgi:type II secretory pathway pseudopilin PulG
MVSTYFPNLKSAERGITLIEIIVVIFLIAMFSVIIISDYPKIQRYFALSRAAYKFAQDLRKTEDLGFSGVLLNDKKGVPIIIKGYGMYINVSSQPAKQYIIYADVAGAPINGVRTSDQKYSGDLSYPLCSQVDQQNNENNGMRTTDCVMEIINVTNANPDLYIKPVINNISGNYTSINFSPPNPNINIDNLSPGQFSIGIVLGLTFDPLSTRTVWVNTSGLINVQ